ncbi:rhodanese-like domain-containing protein [Flavobacteriaceae bacterium 14752]|uniref:rhodanese-like domain-containing protein n=1 Tax=Mesohalobacter salilacus TaxID=2491711 RepID=UPI000F631755|nr:rhodanese-like domain-containing protein [Flavobacteriaceae bacterium 14752]
MRLFHFFFLLTLVTGADAQNKIQEISVHQAEYLIEKNEDLLILDVRTPKEFEAGHLDNAVNINFYDKGFADQLSALDTSKPLLIYCHSGYRSHRAIETLKKSDFKTIYDMTEGYVVWKNLKSKNNQN